MGAHVGGLDWRRRHQSIRVRRRGGDLVPPPSSDRLLFMSNVGRGENGAPNESRPRFSPPPHIVHFDPRDNEKRNSRDDNQPGRGSLSGKLWRDGRQEFGLIDSPKGSSDDM